MVVTIGVTIRKISPQAGETCGLFVNYNLTLSRPSEETPMEDLECGCGLDLLLRIILYRGRTGLQGWVGLNHLNASFIAL